MPKTLELNIVKVVETDPPDPPEGEKPIVWRLVTTEPIATPEQVARVVDIYRQRWLIEEYFKALKTGCAFEKRQLDSAHALLMALTIFSAVAWRILALRWLARTQAERLADTLLTKLELDVLKAARRKDGKPLPDLPGMGDAMRAIAALGGHIQNNGDPGWLVLGRGFEALLSLVQGWRLALICQETCGDLINDQTNQYASRLRDPDSLHSSRLAEFEDGL